MGSVNTQRIESRHAKLSAEPLPKGNWLGAWGLGLEELSRQRSDGLNFKQHAIQGQTRHGY